MGTPSRLQPGQQIGSYRILRAVAAGGMGEVYEAFEESLDRRIAIKVTTPTADDGENYTERFKSEARTLAKLTHPNVLAVYSFGEFDSLLYMATEFVDGKDLEGFLNESPCSVHDLLRLFRQMLEGLGAAHRQGIIHRDIKPSNIMIDKSFTVKLVDFGLAKSYAAPASYETAANIVMGTARYLAPELTRGHPASVRSDIFSLGLVLYFMLTGKTAFDGENNLVTLENIRVQELKFSKPLELLLPEELKEIVRRMTHKDPSHRYANVTEILADLEKVNYGDLPEELLHSIPAAANLKNFSEIKNRCASEGFDSGEVRFIVNLAAGLEAGKEEPSDKTRRLTPDTRLIISDGTLRDAINRYRVARARLLKERAHAGPVKKARSYSDPSLRWIAVGFMSVATLWMGWNIFSPTRVPSNTAINEAALPTYRVGERVKLRTRLYRADGSYDVTYQDWKITQVGDLNYIAVSGNYRVNHPINPFLPLFEISADGDSVLASETNTVLGDPNSFFPLRVGKTSVHQVTGNQKNANKAWEFEVRCKVAGQEKVLVESKSYDTFKVECTERGVNYHTETTSFYAPSIRYIVIQDRRVLDPSGKQIDRKYYDLVEAEL